MMPWIFLAGLAWVAYVDLHTMKIPNKMVMLIAIIALLQGKTPLQEAVLSGVIMGTMFLLLSIAFHSFGGGDVKLIAAAALSTSLSTAFAATLISQLICTLVCLPLRSRVEKIPYAPFLFLGYLSITLIQLQ